MAQRCIGIDVETSKIPQHFPWMKGFYLTIVSISYPNDTSRSWVFHHENEYNVFFGKKFAEIQAEIDKYPMSAAHNFKFDLNVLREKITFKNLWCTQVAEYLLNHHSTIGLKLADLAPKYGLTPKLDKVKAMWDAGYDTAEIPISLLTEYCEDDAYKARKIAEAQQLKIASAGLSKVMSLQMEWLDMLSYMECQGMGFDLNRANQIIAKYEKYQRILNKKIIDKTKRVRAGHAISLTSKDELSCLLYGGYLKRREKIPKLTTKNVKVRMPYVFTYADGTKKIKTKWTQHPDTRVIRMVYGDRYYYIEGLGISPPKKGEVAKSTERRRYYKISKDILPFLDTESRLQKTVLSLLLKKSKIDQVVKTFINRDNQTGLVNKVAQDGRLHTNYNQTVTATGRLSSSNPNSQNLPRSGTSPIKECIIPKHDYILNADLSQLEWRVALELSNDQVGLKEIKLGIDAHGDNCTSIMLLPLIKRNRNHAKTFLFRLIYGGTEYGFHRDPRMPAFGLKKWREVVRNFFAKYKSLAKWQSNNVNHVIGGNGTLSLQTGRAYSFRLMENGKYSETQIKNYPVQGLAGGDILPLAAVIIWIGIKRRKLKSFPILTVHDSLGFDTVASEVDELADLCMKVFTNLPAYIKYYWGINWTVPLSGEVEYGKNYGSQTRIR